MTTELMQYLPTAPRSGADKYHGAIAQGYDRKREQSPKWQIEQRIIESMLDDLPSGSWVLDCPTGTGRFLRAYHDRGLLYHAVDISEDMLKQAALKVVDPNKARFHIGDVRALDFLEDKSVDATVMIDLTRWLMGDYGPEGIVQALRELLRVTRSRIIITARVRGHRFAVTYDLINSALDGWKIHRDEEGVDPDYRIIELRPV